MCIVKCFKVVKMLCEEALKVHLPAISFLSLESIFPLHLTVCT